MELKQSFAHIYKKMEGVKQTKLRKKRVKGKIFLVFFIIFLILILFYLNKVVNPIIVEASEAKIRAVSQISLNNSVLDTISENNIYDNLINYAYDTSNKVSMINVNSYYANLLSRKISLNAQTDLDTTTRAGVSVHIGAFTGLAVLATLGPTVNFNLTPIGTVAVKFKSEFFSAGINQTLHKIYVYLESSVYVILPTASPNIKTSTDVLIAECVIVGDIPTTYLQSSYLDEMLNLVPV